jgi:hypothetical protein
LAKTDSSAGLITAKVWPPRASHQTPLMYIRRGISVATAVDIAHLSFDQSKASNSNLRKHFRLTVL